MKAKKYTIFNTYLMTQTFNVGSIELIILLNTLALEC